jgi:Fe-S-cluster containining protein
MNPLVQLHIDIDDRVKSILTDHTDWLCGKGCDGCCRQLARVPQITIAEWDLLREGLTELAPEQFKEIAKRMAAQPLSRPVTCPLLDLTTGACPVYIHRPVACRTYGFYVQRDLGLYCHDIELKVTDGALSDVVWGNHDAVDQRLTALGESRPLTDWFAEWSAAQFLG